MLTNTFCHIPGIGDNIERYLWSVGVMSWDCPLPQVGVKLPRRLRQCWLQHMKESIANHANSNPNYFAENLPTNQHWRLFRDFQGVCAFVDIETTGLYGWDTITTIALYDGRTIRYYVNGDI
jgi:uncharacterized protein YprB with RNaseH-like and TPR domain